MPRTTTLEPPGCPSQLRAICCDSLGFIKVVQVRSQNGAQTGPLDVVARWGQPGNGMGIVAMSYSDAMIAVARKSGTIEVLDSSNGNVSAEVAAPKSEQENDAIFGVHLFQKAGLRSNSILSCRANGSAALQHFEDGKEAEVVSAWSVCKSGSVLTMRVHDKEKFAVFGGDTVELNLWDLESNGKVWEGKKPKPNALRIVPPTFFTCSAFLHKDDHRKIVVGTGDYQVRLYDVEAQRRPVLAFTYGESPIKAVAEDLDGFTVYAGNAVGSIASFDIRTGKVLGVFKGKLAGSVRSLVKHPSLPLIASCGLDRFLRIHDVRSRGLLARIFLKQPLTGVVFDDRILNETTTEAASDRQDSSSTEEIDEDDDDDDDDEQDEDVLAKFSDEDESEEIDEGDSNEDEDESEDDEDESDEPAKKRKRSQKKTESSRKQPDPKPKLKNKRKHAEEASSRKTKSAKPKKKQKKLKPKG